MKYLMLLFLIAGMSVAPFSAAHGDSAETPREEQAGRARDVNRGIFQTSTLEALLQGLYDGHMTVGELKKHGEFGLGTYDRLDGEMIVLDGVFYQVKSDGVAYRAGDAMTTPFAAVTRFRPDKTLSVNGPMKCAELKDALLKLFPTRNILYAVKAAGNFAYLKTRSVPEQEKPYPPLSEVVKSESVFEFENISGTIVGFWMPGYMENLNQTGFHFHFISADGKSGGHVLDCSLSDAEIGIDYIRDVNVALPDTEAFNNADLNKDTND